MLRKIILHGHLADEFGAGPFELAVINVNEAVRALCVQLRGFRSSLRQGAYNVVCKKKLGDLEIGENQLTMSLGSTREVHIIPVLEGGKRSGVGKILMGVAMVATAFIAPFALGATLATPIFTVFGSSFTYGNLAMMGLGMALTGASALLAPTPNSNYDDRETKSYLFTGPLNTSEQGQCVPVVIGRFITGSVVASSSILVEEITEGERTNDSSTRDGYTTEDQPYVGA